MFKTRYLLCIPGLLLVLLRRVRYRLFRRRMRSIDALYYGADPQGILDSAGAIQDALDNMSYIELPPGKFTISKSMNELLRPNTSIYGSGQQSTIIHLEVK